MIKPNSLKLRILINLIAFVTLTWALTLVFGFLATEKTLNQQLDTQLAQVAQSISETIVTSQSTQIRRTDSDERIEVQITHSEENIISNSPDNQNENSPKWRVFSAQNQGSKVSIGENLDVRSALIKSMMWNSLWPMIVALPLLALIIWLSVTSGLKPLSTLASAIQKRTPKQLNPINIGDVPGEVVPVVQSLNSLLTVVESAIEREKEFTDNAAHELRTPLAAIKTQAQVALKSTNDQERTESINAIAQGVDRASHLVNQLLTLARLDPSNLEFSFVIVDLNSLVKKIIAKLTPAALTKQIDLGFLDGISATVIGDSSYLEILISNLIDNAIRYTPIKGIINLSIENTATQTVLKIEDNGPGILEKDRAKVFKRFIRLPGNNVEGSGIGLAIVKKIAELHQAKIELNDTEKHQGLAVKVIFNALTPSS